MPKNHLYEDMGTLRIDVTDGITSISLIFLRFL